MIEILSKETLALQSIFDLILCEVQWKHSQDLGWMWSIRCGQNISQNSKVYNPNEKEQAIADGKIALDRHVQEIQEKLKSDHTPNKT